MLPPGVYLYALSERDIQNRLIYQRRIWQPMRQLYPAIIPSRRLLLSQLTRLYDVADRLMISGDQRYDIPDVDDVFTDQDNRWFSFFIEADDTGNQPQRYSKMHERLQLVALYNDLAIELGEIEPPAGHPAAISHATP